MRRLVSAHNPAPAQFELLDEPVTARDGTVYRWRVVQEPSGCPCTWIVLCDNEQRHYGPTLCERLSPSLFGAPEMLPV